MSSLVLVLSGARIPPDLQAEFGPLPTGLIPLDGRSALELIIPPYLSAGATVVVPVTSDQQAVEEVASKIDTSVLVLDVSPSNSLGSTVSGALRLLAGSWDRIVVHFADSLMMSTGAGALFGGDSVIYVADREEASRYTTVTFLPDGSITGAHEKGIYKGLEHQHALIGLFSSGNVSGLAACLEAYVQHPDALIDPFYGAVIQLHNQSASRQIVQVEDWLDLGHLDTYYEARRRFISARHFNQVAVDPRRGVIRKTSTNRDKLRDEIRWYLELPPTLSHLAPRVFSYSLEADPFVELEYYGYPALADVYVSGRWDLGAWARCLEAIHDALTLMQGARPPIPASVDSLREMYVNKTLTRLAEALKAQPALRDLERHEVEVNGGVLPGLLTVRRELEGWLTGSSLLQADFFTHIHGDLCLANILFDARSGSLRLIDPRGAFGESGPFGDQRYDLAKLRHSFVGGYDFIVQGRAEVQQLQPGSYTFRLPGPPETVRQLFDSWLCKWYREWFDQIKLLEGTLFLSMLPLHAEDARRQLSLAIRGLQTLGDRRANSSP